MNSNVSPNPNRSYRNAIALSAIFSLIASLLVFISFTPASAATNIDLIVHVPLAPSESNNVAVTPTGGTEVAGAAKYDDDYGSFAIITVPSAQAEVTIDVTSFTAGSAFTRTGAEIWIDSSGNAFKSRYLAQGCEMEVHYVADSSGDADIAQLHWSEDGGIDSGTITDSSVNSNTATFTYVGNCDAKNVSFNAIVSGTDKTAFDINLKSAGEVWIKDSWPLPRTTQTWANGNITIHWYRSGGYEGYGLHAWPENGEGYSGTAISWAAALAPTGTDAWGKYWQIPVFAASTLVPFIIHSGDTKDPSGIDQSLNLEKTGGEVWLKSGSADADGYAKYSVPVFSDIDANILRQKGIWLRKGVIAWPTAITAAEYDGHAKLYYSAEANLEADETGVTGQDGSVVLEYVSSLTKALRDKYPYLRDYVALKIPVADQENVKTWLRGQVAVEILNDEKTAPLKVSGLQLGDVLDDVYPDAKNVTPGITWSGSNPTITVWAPTAQSVSVNLFDNSADESATSLGMTRDNETGTWSFTGDAAWDLKQYTFTVDVYAPSTGRIETNEVTDPYSISLSTNSLRSQIVNLDDAALKPSGWDSMVKPSFARIADATVYELMVRDFSIIDDSVSNEDWKGGYMAFTDLNSDGMKHLTALADAGLTHLQLGPVFDLASVDEDKNNWETIDWNELGGMTSNGTGQKTAVSAIRDVDGFNWGYDPLHYTAPEGSFATNPDDETRVLEFRSMIKGINDIGLRTVMDVVYNHTSGSGQASSSILDRVVPGYYHRLNASGGVETSTCCKNTATERMMMAKLNLDSVVTWAKEYKVDGFRFDLMGHQPKAQMVELRAALDALTIANDGVDGKKILIFGEGWNFGEVQNGARFPNAVQTAMDGTGIGTFDDRVRDNVRGGGPFDGDPRKQGFASGKYGYSNGYFGSGTAKLDQQINMDQIKVSLTGGIQDFLMKTYRNTNTTGQGVASNGAATGYTKNPIEQISYVDAHDNETLYDALAYKLPTTATMAERVRYQVLGLAVPTMGQGLPFVLAGSDLLRSKSMDKNSYNSGDWYNAIDWTLGTNGFGRGLPIEVTNLSQATTLLGMSSLVPTADDMNKTSGMWQDLLKVRYSSKLFRLGTGAAIKKRVKFVTYGSKSPLGLIVMKINDTGKGITNIDPNYKSIVVVFNASHKSITYTAKSLAKAKLSLHPVLKSGVDSVVKTSKFKKGKFTIPAVTVAVFVEK
jgi:pullulanase-type alpha-1,6-glucosidase